MVGAFFILGVILFAWVDIRDDFDPILGHSSLLDGVQVLFCIFPFLLFSPSGRGFLLLLFIFCFVGFGFDGSEILCQQSIVEFLCGSLFWWWWLCLLLLQNPIWKLGYYFLFFIFIFIFLYICCFNSIYLQCALFLIINGWNAGFCSLLFQHLIVLFPFLLEFSMALLVL